MTDRMKLHNAIIFATKAHAGQPRKGTDVDYICHPLEVAQILTEIVDRGGQPNDELIIAGVLHDVLEECPDIKPAEIEERFGTEVARLVNAHTHSKKGGWKERKQKALDEFKAADREVQILVLADKLSNLRSIYADFLEVGDEIWERFNAGKEQQCWYYNEFLDTIVDMQNQSDVRDAYWEATELFKDIFISYYIDEESGTIWQVCPPISTYVCSKQKPDWVEVSEPVPSSAVPTQRLEAEKLEDVWIDRRKRVQAAIEHLAEIKRKVRKEGRAIREDNDGFRYTDYLDMTNAEVEEALEFHGQRCCRFDKYVPDTQAKEMTEGLEIIFRFGEALCYEDNEVINWFNNTSDGNRKLRRCPECGALFLEQYGTDCIWGSGDDIYTYDHEYCQVESMEHAIKLNLLLGSALKGYKGPSFGTFEVC